MANGTVKLTRTPGATGNRKTYTLSYWIKRGDLTEIQQIWNVYSAGSDYMYMRFIASGALYLESYTGGASNIGFTTNRLFRDPGAWYHIVLAVDTAQSVSTDRWKLYVNGVQETSFSSSSYSTEDVLTSANTDTFPLYIGANQDTDQGFSGVMAHVHLTDGTAYAPTAFGETDATSGVWVPKTSPSVTYGDNGFFLKFASGALGTDSSGEGNNMTVSGTMTNTKDTPDNNFATINPLDDYYQESTYSNGNTKVVTESGSAVYAFNTATMGVDTGKWYWEVKYTNSTAGGAFMYGVAAEMATSASTELGQTANQIGLLNNDTTRTNNTATAFGDGDYTTGDIMMCALDMTNSRIFFGKNGVWMTPSAGSGGDPTDGTGNVALPTAVASTPMGVYVPAFGPYVNASQTYEVNFGNGYFGTTLDGTNADDAGIGLFKYDVPAGYYALCTNNLGDQS